MRRKLDAHVIILLVLMLFDRTLSLTDQKTDQNEEKKRIVTKHLKEHLADVSFGNAVLKWLRFEEQSCGIYSGTNG